MTPFSSKGQCKKGNNTKRYVAKCLLKATKIKSDKTKFFFAF